MSRTWPTIALFGGLLALPFSAPTIQHNIPPRLSQTKIQTAPSQQSHTSVFFAPDDAIKHTLVDLIAAEQVGICIAAYRLTEHAYAKELVAAHARGVRIEIVADHDGLDGFSSQIPMLASSCIPIYSFPPHACTTDDKAQACPPLMHNKFMIFLSNKGGRAWVWTGSLNFTYSAHSKNQENCILTDDPCVVERYQAQFEKLKKRSELIANS